MSVDENKRLLGKAVELADVGHVRDSLAIVDRVIANSPACLEALVFKARLLRDASMPAEAEALIREAIRIDPENPYAWGELGLLLTERDDMKKAAFCFERVVTKLPDHSTYTLLAHAQLAFDPAAAIASAKRALEFWPESVEAQGVLKAATMALQE